jgi:hypothetical protein
MLVEERVAVRDGGGGQARAELYVVCPKERRAPAVRHVEKPSAGEYSKRARAQKGGARQTTHAFGRLAPAATRLAAGTAALAPSAAATPGGAAGLATPAARRLTTGTAALAPSGAAASGGPGASGGPAARRLATGTSALAPGGAAAATAASSGPAAPRAHAQAHAQAKRRPTTRISRTAVAEAFLKRFYRVALVASL